MKLVKLKNATKKIIELKKLEFKWRRSKLSNYQ